MILPFGLLEVLRASNCHLDTNPTQGLPFLGLDRLGKLLSVHNEGQEEHFPDL